MTCSYNSTTREAEVRESRVQREPRLHKTLPQKRSEKPQIKYQLVVKQCVQKTEYWGRVLSLCFSKGGHLCECLYPLYGALAVSLRSLLGLYACVFNYWLKAPSTHLHSCVPSTQMWAWHREGVQYHLVNEQMTKTSLL